MWGAIHRSWDPRFQCDLHVEDSYLLNRQLIDRPWLKCSFTSLLEKKFLANLSPQLVVSFPNILIRNDNSFIVPEFISSIIQNLSDCHSQQRGISRTTDIALLVFFWRVILLNWPENRINFCLDFSLFTFRKLETYEKANALRPKRWTCSCSFNNLNTGLMVNIFTSEMLPGPGKIPYQINKWFEEWNPTLTEYSTQRKYNLTSSISKKLKSILVFIHDGWEEMITITTIRTTNINFSLFGQISIFK